MGTVVDHPTNKMEATRILLTRDPEMDHLQLQAALRKEFKMHMSPKQSYNYRRDVLAKMNHPKRPTRSSSNGAGQAGQATQPAPASPTQLDELMRIGNEIGWEEVLKTAQIAVKVRK